MQLRERVSRVSQLIPRDRPVVFLDYPVHTNIGDLLIERGTARFFVAHGYDVVLRRSALDFGQAAERHVSPDATIVLHGGGNFGDLYPLHQEFRERVIRRFPENRIVMLPQSLQFDSDARLRESADIFAAHSDLHVCVRDRDSLEIVRRHFSNPVYLMPDMAHFLFGDIKSRRRPVAARRVLRFLRIDKEARSPPGMIGPPEMPLDWRDVIPRRDRLTFRVLHGLHAANQAGRVALYGPWAAFTDRLIGRALRRLEFYDGVLTNRLHMGILALLVGREVALADNTYGKLSRYYLTWLKDAPAVRFLT